MRSWAPLVILGLLGCQGPFAGLSPQTGRSATRIPPPPTGTLGSNASGYDRPGDFRPPGSNPAPNPADTSWWNPGDTYAPRRSATGIGGGGQTRVASTPVRAPGGNSQVPPSAIDDSNLSWRDPARGPVPPPGYEFVPYPGENEGYMAEDYDDGTRAPRFRYRRY